MEALVKKMDKVFYNNKFVKPATVIKNRKFKLTTRVGNLGSALNASVSQHELEEAHKERDESLKTDEMMQIEKRRLKQ